MIFQIHMIYPTVVFFLTIWELRNAIWTDIFTPFHRSQKAHLFLQGYQTICDRASQGPHASCLLHSEKKAAIIKIQLPN